MNYAIQEQAEVRRGATWAIGIGIFTAVAGVAICILSAKLSEGEADPALLLYAAASLGVGGYSVQAGRKLRDPSSASSKQFVILIWIFGIVIGIRLVSDIGAIVQGERLTGLFGYLIPIWAILKFNRGKQVLQAMEAERESADTAQSGTTAPSRT